MISDASIAKFPQLCLFVSLSLHNLIPKNLKAMVGVEF